MCSSLSCQRYVPSAAVFLLSFSPPPHYCQCHLSISLTPSPRRNRTRPKRPFSVISAASPLRGSMVFLTSLSLRFRPPSCRLAYADASPAQVPLERYFPEYTGGSDINKAAKYILWKFMQANRARLSVYPQYVSLSSFFPFVGQFDFSPSPDASFYPCTMLLTCCATTPYLPHVPRLRLSVCLLVANRTLYGFPPSCDISLLSVLAVPIANRHLLFQSHPSHGY